MTVFLIRHGQSEFNAVFDGSGDPMLIDAVLTPLGRQQAEHARAKAAALEIREVICSPLTRAITTAQLIFPDHTPEILADAREHLGHSCDVGRAPAVLAGEFPAMRFDHLAQAWWHQGALNENDIPVEPQDVFLPRIEGLRNLLQARPNKPLAVVCHANVIKALTGIDVPNCGIVPLDG